MAISFLITNDIDTNCGYITVDDRTTYGASSPDRRQDFGLALFWSEDNFATSDGDLTSPGSATNPAQWTISATNRTLYYIRCFAIPSWSAGSYLDNTVIYYTSNGNFYQNQSGGATVEEPTVGTDWVLLTTADYAQFRDYYTLAYPGGKDAYLDYDEAYLSCPIYVIKKTSSYNHILYDESGQSDQTIDVYAYDQAN